MTRAQVLAVVNRHRAARGLAPLTLRHWPRIVGIARQHRLISPEYLEWAHLGYFPTPAERAARRRSA